MTPFPRLPVPSEAEQRELLAAWREQGDNRARERLLLASIGLVATIIRRYACRATIERDDLIAEGVLALLEAMNGYDLALAVSFSTYAAGCIRHRVKRYAIEQAGVVRIPEHAAPPGYWYRASFDISLDGAVDDAQCIDDTLLAMLGPQTDANLLYIDATAEANVMGAEIAQRVRDTVHRAVRRNHRRRAIAQRRLLACEPESQSDLGRDFGLTRERIRQIENELCAHLHEVLFPLYEELMR